MAEKKNVIYRLPPDLIKLVKIRAIKENLRANQLVEKALVQYFKEAPSIKLMDLMVEEFNK